MAVEALGARTPRIHPTAFVHPAAHVIGDVVLDAHASVWPGAVLRGDFGTIVVGAGSCVEDNCVLHPGSRRPTRIGRDCVIGHAVHLEGVTIEDAVLVGSRSVVLMGATVRTGAAVAAGAVVLPGTDVTAGVRAEGVPARLVARTVDAEETRRGAHTYRELAARYLEHRETLERRRAALR